MTCSFMFGRCQQEAILVKQMGPVPFGVGKQRWLCQKHQLAHRDAVQTFWVPVEVEPFIVIEL